MSETSSRVRLMANLQAAVAEAVSGTMEERGRGFASDREAWAELKECIERTKQMHTDIEKVHKEMWSAVKDRNEDVSPHSRRSSSGVPVFSPRNGRKRPPLQKSPLSASRTIKEVTQMKKLYSKKLGGEAFALDAAQLDTLKKAGYTVPRPEEVIADAAAVKIEPPEGKRAYVVFDFKTGAFKVRTRTQTLAESEVGGFVGEVVSAAILCGFVERADMDNPKADAPATPTTASPLVNMLRDVFLRAASNKTAPAADKPTEAADAPEVVE